MDNINEIIKNKQYNFFSCKSLRVLALRNTNRNMQNIPSSFEDTPNIQVFPC
jgi:hypothetical protein